MITISPDKVKRACDNFKLVADYVDKLATNKLEQYKSEVVCRKVFGIKIPFMKTTKYKQLGFESDSYITRCIAFLNLYSSVYNDFKDNMTNSLGIYYVCRDFPKRYRGFTDNTHTIHIYLSSCLQAIRNEEFSTIVLTNNYQVRFVNDYSDLEIQLPIIK